MAAKDVIELANKTIKICQFNGMVAESTKQREVQVSGSTWDGYGTVQSETTIHDQFFLIHEDGDEEVFDLQNWDVPMRGGHIVQVVWLIPPKRNAGPYVAVYNKTLDRLAWSEDAIKEVVAPNAGQFTFILVIVIVLSTVLFISLQGESILPNLLIILAIAGFIFLNYKRNHDSKKVKAKVRELLI